MDVKPQPQFVITVTEKELKIIGKALATFSGVTVTTSSAERLEASALNLRVLDQRRKHAMEQLDLVTRALHAAEEAAIKVTYAAAEEGTNEAPH